MEKRNNIDDINSNLNNVQNKNSISNQDITKNILENTNKRLQGQNDNPNSNLTANEISSWKINHQINEALDNKMKGKSTLNTSIESNHSVKEISNKITNEHHHIDIDLDTKISSSATKSLGIDDMEESNHSKKDFQNSKMNFGDENTRKANLNNFKKKEDTNTKPTFNLNETLLIVLLTGIVCAIASGTIVNHKYSTKNGTSYNTLLKDENIQEFLDVYATLNDSYYESVDKKAAIEGAIAGLMSSAGDNYTSYLDKEDADILNDSLNGKYEGVGIAINSKDVGLIEKVYPNSPASSAGLQKGDRIISVNAQEIRDMNSNEIAKLIKDSQNKKAKLTISRGEETFEVELEIKSLATPAIDYTIFTEDEKKVGYLAISTFSDTLANQVESALIEMENDGIESLIIDLRNNGGGLLTAAKDTASLFLEKGKAIYGLEGNEKSNKTKFYYDETETSRNYPIVVLVNGKTASASEILTMALKDSYGATTVGTTTYGKGKVQQTKKLSDGSLVKYTTSRWLTPNNECIDEYGISPDYGVEIEYQYDDNNEIVGYTDTQLAKARSLLGLREYPNDDTTSSSNNINTEENIFSNPNQNVEQNNANQNE